MGIKKGDLIDERKRHSESCGLALKVMGGGDGVEPIGEIAQNFFFRCQIEVHGGELLA